MPSALSVVQNGSCLYDQAGNRTSEQINNGVSAAMVNNLNQVAALRILSLIQIY